MEDKDIIASIRLSEVLRKLREASGLTQQQLALRLNLSRQTVNYIERGRMIPNREVITNWVSIFIERKVEK